MKKYIFSDTVLKEVQDFKGRFIDIPESLNFPELAEEKELGMMTTFEKRLFTLSMRRVLQAQKIIDKVIPRGKKEISICDTCKFHKYASDEEKSEYEKLLIESESINIIFYNFIKLRFSNLGSNIVILPTPGYKIIAGKPKLNFSIIPIEPLMQDFSKGVFGQPIGGEA